MQLSSIFICPDAIYNTCSQLVGPNDKTIISKNTKIIVQRGFASDVLSSARYHHPFFSECFQSELFNSDERLLCDNGTSRPSTENHHHQRYLVLGLVGLGLPLLQWLGLVGLALWLVSGIAAR